VPTDRPGTFGRVFSCDASHVRHRLNAGDISQGGDNASISGSSSAPREIQVGALSYTGQLNLDIVADANLVPDLTVFANGMTSDLKRLGAASHQRG